MRLQSWISRGNAESSSHLINHVNDEEENDSHPRRSFFTDDTKWAKRGNLMFRCLGKSEEDRWKIGWSHQINYYIIIVAKMGIVAKNKKLPSKT